MPAFLYIARGCKAPPGWLPGCIVDVGAMYPAADGGKSYLAGMKAPDQRRC